METLVKNIAEEFINLDSSSSEKDVTIKYKLYISFHNNYIIISCEDIEKNLYLPNEKKILYQKKFSLEKLKKKLLINFNSIEELKPYFEKSKKDKNYKIIEGKKSLIINFKHPLNEIFVIPLSKSNYNSYQALLLSAGSALAMIIYDLYKEESEYEKMSKFEKIWHRLTNWGNRNIKRSFSK